MTKEITKEYNVSMRLKQYMEMTGLKQVDILEKCKRYTEKYGIDLSQALLSAYVMGKAEPGNKRIFILTKALNVNELWLMGYDVPMEPDIDFQADKNDLKIILSMLNDDGRRKLIDYAEDLADNPKYIKK